MPDETPLIWTARGNLPIDDLDYSTRWEQKDDSLALVETYRLGGEVVRESVHVYALRGLFSSAEASAIN